MSTFRAHSSCRRTSSGFPLISLATSVKTHFSTARARPPPTDRVASGPQRLPVVEAQHVISRLEGNKSVQAGPRGEQRIRDKLGAEHAHGDAPCALSHAVRTRLGISDVSSS
jgi:hypothetical protein